jgi:hypothetical protein
MFRYSVIFLSSVTALAATSCSFSTRLAGSTGTGGMSGDGIGGNTVNITFRSDAAIEYITSDANSETGPSVDANCGSVPFGVTTLPPDLLIVLDRSGSMDQSVTGGNCGAGCVSKWTQVITAINEVVMKTEANINWGLKFFGTDNACAVAAGASVAPGPNNAAAIAAAIADPLNQPASQTPTTLGEISAGEYLATLTDVNPKFVLLATDGQPNCAAAVGAGGRGGGQRNMNDDAAAIQSVATVKSMGFPTFVIGVATTGSTADTTLSQMAMNGGYPTGGTSQYYSVMSTADLVTALATISTITTGMCTYDLGPPNAEADMSRTAVMVDGVSVPKDNPDGWHFDADMKSITFTGSACSDLMGGTSKKVQVLYGCKTGVI